MSLAEYEAFVHAACHVHEDTRRALARRLDRAAGACRRSALRGLRIVGPDTDSGSGSREDLARADGRYNMPDGEVFTSPLETETEGEIRYTFPAVYHGREVEDVRPLRGGPRRPGRGARGNDYLQSLLEMDAGRASSARSRSA